MHNPKEINYNIWAFVLLTNSWWRFKSWWCFWCWRSFTSCQRACCIHSEKNILIHAFDIFQHYYFTCLEKEEKNMNVFFQVSEYLSLYYIYLLLVNYSKICHIYAMKQISWKIPRNIITFQTSSYLSHVECWHILVWCIYEVWQMYTSIQPYKKGFEWENVILSLSIFLLLLSMPLSLYFTVQSMHILPCLKSRAPIKGEQGVHMPPPTFSAPPRTKNWIKDPINSSWASSISVYPTQKSGCIKLICHKISCPAPNCGTPTF